MIKENKVICVIGLGYVGLPLAVEFGKLRPVIGFDIDLKRISKLKMGIDITNECSKKELISSNKLIYTNNINDIKKARIYIVTVPTPVDRAKRPDFSPLVKSCQLIGGILKKGDIVIFESTVYPGATEEVCVPILERSSNFKYNIDFFCGYSPERINPGDKKHRLPDIIKITSGSNPEVANEVDSLYKEIIKAGTFKASSMKVAEAAKVIENTQRDVNIALMNELSLIFNRINIDTHDVLKAAETKWNFLSFRPGLVGGHCIGVDPYYLTHKAQELGYHPEIILAGRKINDSMGKHIGQETIKLMLKNDINIIKSKILVLGFSFKENCPDVRNTKVIDIIETLNEYSVEVDIFDPNIDIRDAYDEYKIKCLNKLNYNIKYDAIIVAVAHNQFIKLGIEKIKKLGSKKCIIYDVKGILEKKFTSGRL